MTAIFTLILTQLVNGVIFSPNLYLENMKQAPLLHFVILKNI